MAINDENRPEWKMKRHKEIQIFHYYIKPMKDVQQLNNAPNWETNRFSKPKARLSDFLGRVKWQHTKSTMPSLRHPHLKFPVLVLIPIHIPIPIPIPILIPILIPI